MFSIIIIAQYAQKIKENEKIYHGETVFSGISESIYFRTLQLAMQFAKKIKNPERICKKQFFRDSIVVT